MSTSQSNYGIDKMLFIKTFYSQMSQKKHYVNKYDKCNGLTLCIVRNTVLWSDLPVSY